jgi:hypothetical protein
MSLTRQSISTGGAMRPFPALARKANAQEFRAETGFVAARSACR